jgi:hypothetical protein
MGRRDGRLSHPLLLIIFLASPGKSIRRRMALVIQIVSAWRDFMKITTLLMIAFVVISVPNIHAKDKKKDQPERGMLEKMEAVPCGAKEHGITGLGTIWASAGITHVNSDEKLCPEYLLRTDDMEYHIRPKDIKHSTVLAVGHEGTFKIKDDRMNLKFEDGDKKTREYRVVSVNPVDTTNQAQNPPNKQPDKP